MLSFFNTKNEVSPVEGLGCNDRKCIYSKQKGCTATKVMYLDGRCVTKCSESDINGLMTKFKGGRKDNRVSGVLR